MNIKTETVSKLTMIKKIINDLDKHFENPEKIDDDIKILRGLLSKAHINLKQLKSMTPEDLINMESGPIELDINNINSLYNEIEILTQLLYKIESENSGN